ncbi:undecaprenyl-phosphate glucose phosphotransferase [Marvinbryantia formatexigens DSM 14469]|uniref:Undecaprenyl-phosphate glucose phosphotransferase n=1 Tax=Marvinbryantia formatexigens DSM 14469 TaxID=478749 RepID=C6LFR3_9FIRM|nr:undecaprenyl-phosphate glucose phosphotransferase [Marvinbryantia formatexigens]EET60648.1 undecaprenyl-phosphate glucose phosphotransferase [Marvinbryantia formatexigens DSM 14469]UWO25632.1 undecaprenyl-phosphate glucose phosphotransferase [Marvinbryantia formatexigens DSM 14469]SDG16599.1 Undecaprenyl-phosphate glucose phosphotransferase [Marvinbryantia formatexigens]
MIKDNQKYFNRLHVLIDALIVVGSYLLAWFVQIKILTEPGTGVYPDSVYMLVLLPLVPGMLLLYSAFNLYTPKRVQGRRLEYGNVIKANLMGILIFLAMTMAIKKIDFSRGVVFTFFALNVTADIIARMLIRGVLRDMRRRGMNLKHVLLVGYGQAAREYIDRILENPQWGYKVLGILDDNTERSTVYRGIHIIGRTEELMELLSVNTLDEIAITLGLSEYYKLEHIVAQCEKSGVHTKFIPDYGNIIPTKPYTEDLMGLPVINIRYVPLSNTFNAIVKRTVDIVGSLICLVLFSPVMLVTAVLIKLTSPGPLIFKQERVGLHNQPFIMYKFRSMEVQKAGAERRGWTTRHDPRVTGIGKLIRKTSIDELPQLVNVLKGEMSLIGPRPERPQFVEKFREEIPRYMIKHQVRPGMTGWAQVNGYRGDTSIRKRIEYDLYYIENWTLGLDIKILFLTVFKGFINKNAY